VDTIVIYTAVLDAREGTVFFVARLLWLRPPQAGLPPWAARSGCYRQAVPVIR